jgi:(p)ppGpp synthase/HD superfamily hydrolase
MAAVLHDVVEDTGCEICDLVDRGFPKHVVTAIDCLTHRSNELYADYIETPLGERKCTTREDRRSSTQHGE